MRAVLLCSFLLLSAFPALSRANSLRMVESINRENMKIVFDSSITVKVNPTTLSGSGGWVRVTWSYVSDPSDDDWVGVYSPPTDDGYRINPSEHAPIKLLYANYSTTHLTMGSGYLRFKLLNMRAPVVFGFFQGGFDDPTMVAVSDTVYFKNYNLPLQGHLALTGDPTEMALQWVTKDAYAPVVKYGTSSGSSSGSYKYTAKANSTTYNTTDMCGSPATDWGWRDPGLLHTVIMDNLTPGTKHYYVYGDSKYGYSQEYTFIAAPKSGSSATTTVISYGDMGCGELDDSFFIKEDIQPDSMNTTDMIYEMVDNVSFVFHIGDMSYARGFSAVWDIFMEQIQPIAARVPYMVCVGNHERNWYDTYPGIFNNSDSGGECGIPHYERFVMPRTGYDKPWFGFDYGQVHFVVMSTEHDFTHGTAQYRWIANHLANVDRSTTPWLIFVGHRPMYIGSKEDEHTEFGEIMQKHLEGLLYTYQVDIAMWAHVHCYQRTCPVYQGECITDEPAPIHVVIGMGGRDLAQGAMPDEYEDWMEVSDFYNYGFTRLIANSTTLIWEFIHNTDNKVYDRTVLYKSSSDSAAVNDEDEGNREGPQPNEL